MKNVLIAGGFVAVLTGCGGGGGSAVSCGFMDAVANAGVSVGNSSNVDAAADSRLGTAASIHSIGNGFIRARGQEFAPGDNAGAFVTPPTGTASSEMTISTYIEDTVVETATGARLTVQDTQGKTMATDYVSFTTSLPFDGVEFSFSSESNAEFLVFELCGFSDV